jgi:hypothetical protein
VGPAAGVEWVPTESNDKAAGSAWTSQLPGAKPLHQRSDAIDSGVVYWTESDCLTPAHDCICFLANADCRWLQDSLEIQDRELALNTVTKLCSFTPADGGSCPDYCNNTDDHAPSWAESPGNLSCTQGFTLDEMRENNNSVDHIVVARAPQTLTDADGTQVMVGYAFAYLHVFPDACFQKAHEYNSFMDDVKVGMAVVSPGNEYCLLLANTLSEWLPNLYPDVHSNPAACDGIVYCSSSPPTLIRKDLETLYGFYNATDPLQEDLVVNKFPSWGAGELTEENYFFLPPQVITNLGSNAEWTYETVIIRESLEG